MKAIVNILDPIAKITRPPQVPANPADAQLWFDARPFPGTPEQPPVRVPYEPVPQRASSTAVSRRVFADIVDSLDPDAAIRKSPTVPSNPDEAAVWFAARPFRMGKP